MRQNIFLGDGPFSSRQVASLRPGLGQFWSPMMMRSMTPWPGPYRSPQVAPSWPGSYRQPMTQQVTRPTSQPMAAGGSDVHCYFCENLPEAPTYWLSEAQAAQWNADRDARCSQVPAVNCQQKYNQLQANIRPSGFNVINFPTATTYAPMMSGRIPVQNPELLG